MRVNARTRLGRTAATAEHMAGTGNVLGDAYGCCMQILPCFVLCLFLVGCGSDMPHEGPEAPNDPAATGGASGGTDTPGRSDGTNVGPAAGTGGSGGGEDGGQGGGAPADAGQGGAGGTGGNGGAGGGGADSGGTGGGGGGTGHDAPSPRITISGRRLLVGGEPYLIRGVCWNPVPRGATHPQGLDYAGYAASDGAMMQAAGLNTLRTYETITDHGVLDTLWSMGIRVLNTVYGWGGDDPSVVTARVEATKDHPAILGWVLGNEWNYNGLYTGLSHTDSMRRINEAAALVKAADSEHPIVTIYGELPRVETIDAMPDIDIWGINAYRGIGFGNLFSTWAARSNKPMFMAEYGADAYNANLPGYDPDSQARATRALTQAILDNASALHDDGVCLGGTIFEWADEWWKDSAGSPHVHDVGGIAPGGGPYPDATFNEEWWGIVDIDRNPRPAYDVLVELYSGMP